MDQLERILQEFIVETISASPDFLKKENIRQKIQDIVLLTIKNGQVNDNNDLKDLFKTIDMSVNALKMVPFDAWKNLKAIKKTR